MEALEKEHDSIYTQCRVCGAKSSFDTLSTYEYSAEDGCPEEYTLGKCRACSELSLFYREDAELMWETLGECPEFQCIWPTEKYYLHFRVPTELGESYSEAVHAFKVGLFRSSAVMIGRTLEAACRDYDQSSTTIFSGLNGMLKDGSLSKEMYDWADELRILRNTGAHATGIEINENEIRSALDFLKIILEIIYDIRPKFNSYISSKNG